MWFIKVYLIIGMIFTVIDVAVLCYYGCLFDSDKPAEKVGEAISFLIEIVLWPRILWVITKLISGRLNEEEYGWYMQGVELRLKRKREMEERNEKLNQELDQVGK